MHTCLYIRVYTFVYTFLNNSLFSLSITLSLCKFLFLYIYFLVHAILPILSLYVSVLLLNTIVSYHIMLLLGLKQVNFVTDFGSE